MKATQVLCQVTEAEPPMGVLSAFMGRCSLDAEVEGKGLSAGGISHFLGILTFLRRTPNAESECPFHPEIVSR